MQLSHILELLALASLPSTVLATEAPTYANFKKVWEENFAGSAGALPNSANWRVINGGANFNNELQTYTNKPANIKLSGKGTLQIFPQRDASQPGGWSSGRIESKYLMTPAKGKITRVESSLRIGGNPAAHKQGIWPAFWMLGQSYNEGVLWPACGEIDIMENINGQSVAQSALHCDTAPGGICNEPSGLVASTSVPDAGFHVWRVQFNRKPTNWQDQAIAVYRDDVSFNKISGAQIGNESVWETLCQSPLYFIANIAVGGDYPGPPNSATYPGTGSQMEIQYVAHYTST